jgi:hypothetical protein
VTAKALGALHVEASEPLSVFGPRFPSAFAVGSTRSAMAAV